MTRARAVSGVTIGGGRRFATPLLLLWLLAPIGAGVGSAQQQRGVEGSPPPVKRFEWDLGGRLHLDGTLASADTTLDRRFELGDDSEVRRARLAFEASWGRHLELEAEYDFAGGGDPKDVWIGARDLPLLGTVRLGHQRKPLGLDQLTSSNDVAFLERAITEDSFAEGRDLGLLVRNAALDERVTWSLGVFQPSDGLDRLDDGAWDFSGRLTGLPWWQREGRQLLHLGVVVQRRDPPLGLARLRTSPEVHLAPAFVDTGEIAAERVENFDLELALVVGPVWLAAEAFRSEVDSLEAGALSFGGYYLQAGWYLTGESRPYRRSQAIWGRVKPRRSIWNGSGWGAWEVALRRSGLDADDGPVTGGELANTTVALNWYPGASTRVSLNWVDAELVDVGRADFVTLRLQLTW